MPCQHELIPGLVGVSPFSMPILTPGSHERVGAWQVAQLQRQNAALLGRLNMAEQERRSMHRKLRCRPRNR